MHFPLSPVLVPASRHRGEFAIYIPRRPFNVRHAFAWLWRSVARRIHGIRGIHGRRAARSSRKRRGGPRRIKTFSRAEISRGLVATGVQQVIFSPGPDEVTVIGGQRSNSRKIYQLPSSLGSALPDRAMKSRVNADARSIVIAIPDQRARCSRVYIS